MNLPNFLTILRILLIPFFIIVFAVPSITRSNWAAIIFILASLTDWIDGYIARKYGQVTLSGKLLDPVADKLLVLSALIMLVEFHRVPSWLAIVIVGRDVAITGLRAIASSIGIVIAAKEMGKIKTLVQIIAIVFLILNYPVFFSSRVIDLHTFGSVILWYSAILSLISAGDYIFRFWKGVKKT
ncbi:MAG: CDP-diacylglycerol--glycerol-3-phosphate 3-phosphatidyltransferase [Nitrospirae bacterium]|nr:CDP-diacylglycerol--glycerol-3-phosphate 3-phosphatidyltransferase [Nitrospirota bacterium]